MRSLRFLAVPFLVAGICGTPIGVAQNLGSESKSRAEAVQRGKTPALGGSLALAPPCSYREIAMEPITLGEAIGRSLCHDPALRQAFGNAQLRSAQVDQRRAAYLPRLDGQGNQSWGSSTEDSSGSQQTTRTDRRSQTSALNLAWVLYDSGQREAALDVALHMLAAANADQKAALQRAFLDTAQSYFLLQAENWRLAAAEEVLAFAEQNFVAASERHLAGAAALADRLQAQAAYTQAKLRLSRERGAHATAQGVLALKIGLAANSSIEIETKEPVLPTQTYLEQVDELIAMAHQRHPVLIAAHARVEAARAAVAEAKAAGRPTLTLNGSLTRERHRFSGSADSGNDRRDSTIGLQLSIPLFRGFQHTHQVQQSQAEAAISAAELSTHRQRISVEVWTYHTNLKMETENLAHTQQLVEQSSQSLGIMRGRYQAGIGTMTDVLNALGAYASAREQHIEAIRAWQVTRLSLAGSLGRLGSWDLSYAHD